MRKILQRQLLTFLGTRWGIILCLLGVFFTVNTVMHTVSRIYAGSYISPQCVTARDALLLARVFVL